MKKGNGMKIVKRNTCCVMEGKEKCLYIIPSAEKLSDGSIIVSALQASYMRDAQAKIRTVRSYDGGKTFIQVVPPTVWDEMEYPEKGFCNCHITEIIPGELLSVYMLVHALPGMPIYNPDTDGIADCSLRSVKSYDNGETWSRPKNIDIILPDVIAPGKPLVLKDGSIGFPMETQKIWDRPFSRWPCAGFIKSYDKGESFPELNLIVEMDGVLHGDGRLGMNEKGDVTAYLWKYDIRSARDMLVHRSISYDNGKSWSFPEPLNLKGQITSPVFLQNGNVLCITQDRFSETPGIKAFLSYNDGIDWDTGSCLVVYGNSGRPDVNNPFQGFTGYKFGYSSLLKITEDDVAAFYFYENENGHMCIGMTELEIILA
jgi:hypothetical protein